MGDSRDNLYITGLPPGISDDKVKEIFGQYGMVTSVKVLPHDPSKPDVVALVRMADSDQAKMIIDNLNGKIPVGLGAPLNIKMANAYGYRGGWGKGGGKGFDPYAMMMMMMKGKGKGKGWGKGWGRNLSDFPPEKKVWVGGLPESVTFKELHEHFASIGSGTGRFAMIMKGGQGGVAFTTAEEAVAAIQSYNGSVLGGATIQVDAWTKKQPQP